MNKSGFKNKGSQLKRSGFKRKGFTINVTNAQTVFAAVGQLVGEKRTHIEYSEFGTVPPQMRKTPLRARKPMKRGKGTTMSKTLRAEVGSDKEYTLCSLHGYQDKFGPCAGRVTREHAMYYAGKKIQEKWAIIPCCAQHHGVDLFQDGPGEAPKDAREWVALNRATESELKSISKVTNYHHRKEYLNGVYGLWKSPVNKL